MLDLEPATRAFSDLLAGVRDDQLADPTPCARACLGDLIDHVDGVSIAFCAAARKVPLAESAQPPTADVARLDADWRSQVPERLAGLSAAWGDEDAWAGLTSAGGIELPAEVAGVVALNEVIVHGWDIAVASGQHMSCDPHLAEEAFAFVQSTVAAHPHGSAGLFGAPVPVPDAAPLMERLIGLTGRDPAWRPSRG
jgi:uncharacterized protein (TIGR03086 family)